MIRRTIVPTALILVLGLAAADARQINLYQGRPLASVLSELQERGLRIVYSTAVVRPSMTVLEEPTSDDPRKILDEMLAPHGLLAVEGPGGTLSIAVDPDAVPLGTIEGVALLGGRAPLGVTVEIVVDGTALRAVTAVDGRFVIEEVPAGILSLTATADGFSPQRIEGIRVTGGSTAKVRFELIPLSVFLSEVIITPSHFRLLHIEPESRQFLTREEVERMPHAANDLYRAVKRLPGSAGGDYSARFNVRGGADDELLVILDGLELYEPFHLKDFQNVFSTIDSEAVGGVDFLTGGYPAEYGDRMSGVMDISLATPSGPTLTTIEIGTLNSRIQSQGSFNEGRGGWFVSGRAWYPAAVATVVTGDENAITTDYYDLVAKIQHQLGVRSTLSANILVAYDDLGFREEDADEVQNVSAIYGSYHAWLNLQTQWNADLSSQTVLSAGRLRRERNGGVDEVDQGTLVVDDQRSFNVFNLGQDWLFQLSDRHFLKFGFDLTHSGAEYEYLNRSTYQPPSSATVFLEPEGTAAAVYGSDRILLTDDLIVEFGLRWDGQTWIDENQISPRINLAYRAGSDTTLRFAWGRFYQSQRLNELQVEDGVDEFYPAQLAVHWMASVEHGFSRALAARFELYSKDLSNLRPRYENLYNPIELFPETAPDRILVEPDRGRARGFELIFKGSVGPKVNWWASYTLAEAEDLIDQEWQPRSWDQRHAAVAGLNWVFDRGWNLSFAGTYHSGWPTTAFAAERVEGPDGEEIIVPILGPRNAERYPSYHRFDVRVSKLFPTSAGDLTLIIEVLNLTNRENICCIEDFEFEVEEDQSVTVLPQPRYWAPIIPSIALRWQF